MLGDWFELHPEEDPNIFYRKLSCMSERHLNINFYKFQQYSTYFNVLNFHLTACKKPETNVRVTYNDKNGWHLSCCLKSVPIYHEGLVCSCREDIANPQKFFSKLENNRCKLCKLPEWEDSSSRETNKNHVRYSERFILDPVDDTVSVEATN